MGYSQNNEEQIILDYFGDFVGTFCDIGANDGETFSNTARLIELGWGGDMIEPHPGAYEACRLRYLANPSIDVHNVAIGSQNEPVLFHSASDSMLSTAVESHKAHWPTTDFTQIEVDQVTWLEFAHNTYDFVSIDAEAMDWEILKQIDLSNVKMLCIEYGEFEDEITAYCELYGMRHIASTVQNLLFGK